MANTRWTDVPRNSSPPAGGHLDWVTMGLALDAERTGEIACGHFTESSRAHEPLVLGTARCMPATNSFPSLQWHRVGARAEVTQPNTGEQSRTHMPTMVL